MSFLSSRKLGRVLAAGAILTAGALGLSACASSSPSATESSSAAANYGTLNLQLSWIKDIEFSGEFFADSKGYYKAAGFDAVNMTPGPSTGTAELLSGKADVALSDAVSTATAIAQGQPLKIIGTTFQKNPFTILSLTEKTPISTPQELIGKKIGVDDSNTAVFDAFLAANGIDKSQVTVVPGAFNGPTLLEGGQVDGYVSYLTNEAIQVGVDGYTAVNLAFADNKLPYVAETFTTTQDMIDNHKAELEAFLKAEIQGWTDAVNDPQGGADLATGTYGKDLKLDPKLEAAAAKAQVELITTDETKANGLFTISDTLKSETVASLATAGITVTADQLFDTSLLSDVYAANPDLVNYSK
jgi:ABC-type nitrate/sulfonate/bicarbonate transport system substrate-binding protein